MRTLQKEYFSYSSNMHVATELLTDHRDTPFMPRAIMSIEET